MGGTTHMTMVFNTYVFYTFFNLINSRVIEDEFNIFYNIHKNWVFFLIFGVEMILQVLIIQFGSNFFKVASGGLTASQWGICFGFAFITFPVSVLCKLLPIDNCIKNILDKCCSCNNNKDDYEKEDDNLKNSQDKDRKKENYKSVDSYDHSSEAYGLNVKGQTYDSEDEEDTNFKRK